MSDLLGYAHPVLDALDAAVPLEIVNLRGMEADERCAYARAHAALLQQCADAMLMGVAKATRGTSAEDRVRRQMASNFAVWTRVLAALAYQPGGVNFGTRHWCADHELLCVRPLAGTPFERSTRAPRRGIPPTLLDFARRWESAPPPEDDDEGRLLCCRCLRTESDHVDGDCDGYSTDWDAIPTTSIGWSRAPRPE